MTAPIAVESTGAPAAPECTPRLTARQMEILTLAAEGLGNAQIGRRLHICEDTVKTHMRRICAALGACNRTNLIHVAYQRGVLVAASPQPLFVKRGLLFMAAGGTR